MHLKQVKLSYEKADLLYQLFWRKNKESSLHFGYWEKETSNLSDALLTHKKRLAEMMNIPKEANILDMGCGVGGAAFYLAKEFNAKVTGVNISSKQLYEAKEKANRLALENQVKFLETDYLSTGLHDNSFDVIWAVESFFHCEDKNTFIQEAYRLLKPNGILAIADYFTGKKTITKKEQKLLDDWFRGFHIPYLISSVEFKRLANEACFSQVIYKNVSKEVMPSSARLHLLGKLGLLTAFPLKILPKSIRQKLPFQEAHALATVRQYQALKKNLWEYGFMVARK
ncbi:MAG: methyltransferase domain-containing protein [Bacteroidota bacterium]